MIDPIEERRKVTRLDYRLKMSYKATPSSTPIIVDLTGLLEHGLVAFMFDISNEGESFPKVKDAKSTLEMIFDNITGEW